MKQYEYRVIVKATPAAMKEKKIEEFGVKLEEELNLLGREGWELVQWKNSMILLKREIL